MYNIQCFAKFSTVHHVSVVKWKGPCFVTSNYCTFNCIWRHLNWLITSSNPLFKMATESSNIKNMSPSFDQNGVPLMLKWTTHDVANWIRDEVGFPQYQECFRANFIDGRQLINIDASSLPRIGVTDFEHVKVCRWIFRTVSNVDDWACENKYWL